MVAARILAGQSAPDPTALHPRLTKLLDVLEDFTQRGGGGPVSVSVVALSVLAFIDANPNAVPYRMRSER